MGEKIFIPKDHDLLNPKVDSTFKTLFIRDGEKSKVALRSLARAIIGYEPQTVDVLNGEMPKNIEKAKDIRLDLLCKMKDGDIINIEIQTCPCNDNLMNRSLYYASRMVSSIDLKGVHYDGLPKVYHVMFTNFQLFKSENKYLQRFILRNDVNEVMTDCLQFVFIQMSLFDIGKKKINNLSDIEKWIIFLRDSDDKNKRDLLNGVMASDEGIREAGEILMSISKETREWARQEMRFKAQQDREAEEALHRIKIKQAKEEGREEGREECLVNTARGMKAKNIPIETIVDITGLTEEQVAAL